MYIVGFNGPPECGKDSMARALADHMDTQGVSIPVFIMPLSFPLRLIAHSMIGQDYVPETYEQFKRTEYPAFGGVTGRQLMIDASERFLKQCYGQPIMARLLLQRIPAECEKSCVILVPDCGFAVESTELGQAVGANNFYVARVVRRGKHFFNDSREWVDAPNDGDYPNDGTLADLRIEAGRLYGRLVNQMGWQL